MKSKNSWVKFHSISTLTILLLKTYIRISFLDATRNLVSLAVRLNILQKHSSFVITTQDYVQRFTIATSWLKNPRLMQADLVTVTASDKFNLFKLGKIGSLNCS